jgi:glucuronokinase
MKTWADYAAQGRQALMARDYETLDRLINANFDLRAKIFQLSEGNLEMVHAARRAGATSNFAGSGGAIVGTYKDEDMYRRLQSELQKTGVAVLRPRIR